MFALGPAIFCPIKRRALPVLSQLDFHDSRSVGPYPTPPHTASTAVTEDYIAGVTWALIGHESAVVTTGSGIMTLPQYAASAGSSNGVLFSGPIGGLDTCDDFTLEVSHDEDGSSIYPSVQIVHMVGACFASPGGGPSATGEWSLRSRHDGGTGHRWLEFGVRGSAGQVGYVATDPSTFDVPHGAGTVREIAVVRYLGLLYIFVNGFLRGTQNTGSFPVNHQALVPYATFGGGSDGAYYLPNNYGSGKYSRWRLTARALYTASYTPTGAPFPAP